MSATVDPTPSPGTRIGRVLDPDELLGVEGVAEELTRRGVPTGTRQVYDLVSRKTAPLPMIRLGKRKVITRKALTAWIDAAIEAATRQTAQGRYVKAGRAGAERRAGA